MPGTYPMLDILDEYGVKATFFLSAWRLPANAEIAREVVARGHSLQSHGFMHDRWPDMSSDAVRRDLEEGQPTDLRRHRRHPHLRAAALRGQQ